MPYCDTKEPSAPSIGGYRIISRIGQGGLAEVYKAHQPSLQRDVAIKVLSAKYVHDSEVVQRFEREALVIARLNHPHIVQIIDRGVLGGRYYFVMEYVDGADFRAVMADPAVDLRTKLEMIRAVCQAVEFAHKNGVVHRDLKPANILVNRQGHVKVADFGIAQLRDKPNHEATSANVIMGTVAYMSPEQKFSAATVTPAADIYALGVILYEVCCGRKPEGRFQLPSEIDPHLPQAFDEIILKCLAENPADRFASASALHDALAAVIEGQAAPSDSTEIGTARVESFIGKCRFLDTIKDDRFGATYLVENNETKRLYIIKKNKRSRAGLKEARLLSVLRQPHIVTILGAGGTAMTTVVVTEYAPGGSLVDRLGKSHTWPEAMAIVAPVAEALHFAHKNMIIHGDLRPSNILFDKDDQVKVTDFGLPQHYSGRKDWYAPPENKPSRQGDIYALGVIMHLLLAGQRPEYDHDGNPNLKDLERRVPQTVIGIMKRMLAFNVADRYQSLESMLAEYHDFVRSLDTPTPGFEEPDDQQSHRSRRWIRVVVALAIIAIISLAVVGYFLK